MLKINVWVTVIICFLFQSTWAQLSTPQAVTGEYIVKFKNKVSVGAGLKVVGQMGAGVSVKAVFAGSQLMHVKVDSESTKNSLMQNPDVEYVEPNFLLSVNPVDQSALGSAPQPSDTYDQSGSKVKVTESWAIQKPYNQGSKITVAIIDTGLDRNHGLFKDSGSIWENTAEINGVPGRDDDGNGYIDDYNGWNFAANNNNMNDDNDHGTHCAGIVLGVGQDVFANPVRESKVKIMGLKFLDSNGSGSTSDAIKAIEYAIKNGAKVISNSWGGPSYSKALQDAYTYAYNSGVVIVSAAGNSNTNNDVTAMYPANFDTPNNISVLAASDSDAKASFSNYGATTVDVAAPGVAILSSVPGTGCLAPGCFQMMSGTSMATPFVAGLAALVFREAPQLSAYQVKSVIIGTVDVVSGLSGKVISGGRVNALKAITEAKNQISTQPWSPSYSSNSSRSPASTQDAMAAPAGCGLVKAIADNAGGGPGDGAMAVVVMIALPLMIALALRSQTKQLVPVANRRLYERFMVSKGAVLQVCDQLINITTADISLGGISFKGEASGLSKGQIIKFKFSEGSEEQIEAEVVWCSQRNEYGLKFLNITEKIKFEIQSWTNGLAPAT